MRDKNGEKGLTFVGPIFSAKVSAKRMNSNEHSNTEKRVFKPFLNERERL